MTIRILPFLQSPRLVEGIDALALAAWGILLLKYWLTGKMSLLIHPHYFWLTIAAGLTLLLMAVLQTWKLCRARSAPTLGHFTLLPRGWMSSLLLGAALLGLLITPRPFASQTAIQRGLTDSLLITRTQPQAFRSAVSPEQRSLIDWVRTLDVYPEPDAYTGQKVKVQGFVVYAPDLPNQYLMLTRFVITCCAADAYPVGLPVKLPQGSRQAYPQDQWLEVEGQMRTETLVGKRQLTIAARVLKPIPEPANPYSY